MGTRDPLAQADEVTSPAFRHRSVVLIKQNCAPVRVHFTNTKR